MSTKNTAQLIQDQGKPDEAATLFREDLEVIATSRPRGSSSKLAIFSVRLDEIRSMGSHELPSGEAGKLAGCLGWPVSSLLNVAADSLGEPLDPATVGIFTASDGLETEPISLSDLMCGIIIHSNPDGSPLIAGGPMRLWFPSGKAIQHNKCGTDGPANLKGVIRLSLSIRDVSHPVVNDSP